MLFCLAPKSNTCIGVFTVPVCIPIPFKNVFVKKRLLPIAAILIVLTFSNTSAWVGIGIPTPL